MKRVSFVTGVLLLLNSLALGTGYAQSAPSKGELPLETPASVSGQIEKLHSLDPEERGQAAQTLGKMGEGAVAAVPFLIQALNDNACLVVLDPEGEASSSSVAEAAMRALMEIGSPAVDPLVASLGDSDPGVRMMATKALGGIQDPRTIAALIGALEGDGDALVQATAVDALRRKGDPRALEALVLAEQDESWMVRSLARSAVEEARTEEGGAAPAPSGEAPGTTTEPESPEPVDSGPPTEVEQRPRGETVPVAERTYRVQPGDTFYSIGRRYGVAWQRLMEYNGIPDSFSLLAGQELKIPGRGAGKAPQVWDGVTTYRVQHGDILYEIGLLFGMSWREIAALNGITDPNQISVGQVLKIPQRRAVPAP